MKSKKQSRKPFKRKESSLQTALSDTMSMGIGSMVGMSAIGTIKGMIPGGVGDKTAKIVNSSIGLLNTAQLLKNTDVILKKFK